MPEKSNRKSDQHSADWTTLKRLKREPTMTQDDWEKSITSQYDEWSKSTMAKNEMQVRALSYCVQEYQKNRDAGVDDLEVNAEGDEDNMEVDTEDNEDDLEVDTKDESDVA
ncbi:hypothetical protein P171DRAFT_485344 [Karstenula rhodostoma CBS 690.94]|uniref:Uncharacterized protein n=1 Tax=Karstenula rhodostoma CBS 690.94 TaxID=1392251 RepID=A0A9P4PHS8_9PLEO|nr:hypothetical protein P171DRAFT_485344 [Karstenula rhodostoma CBS 690.94]